MPCLTSPTPVAFRDNTPPETDLSRLELQNEPTDLFLNALLPFSVNLGFPNRSGVIALPPWFMCGTDALQKQLKMLHLVNSGTSTSQMSPTFEFGAALLICTFKETREHP